MRPTSRRPSPPGVRQSSRARPIPSTGRCTSTTSGLACRTATPAAGRRPTSRTPSPPTGRRSRRPGPIPRTVRGASTTSGTASATATPAAGRSPISRTAITAYRQALEASPADAPDRPMCLNNLGAGLSDRYTRRRALADLEAAITAYEQALEASPADSPDRPMILTNLGNGLSDRYARRRSLADLEAAITASRRRWPPPRPIPPAGRGASATSRMACASAIPAAGRSPIWRTPSRPGGGPSRRTPAEFPRSADVPQQPREWPAHPLCPTRGPDRPRGSDHGLPAGGRGDPGRFPARPMRLSNLGNALRTRYGRRGAAADLEEAITGYRQAVEATSAQFTARPMYVNNLRNGLSDRHPRREALVDLEEVITACGQAVEATETDSPTGRAPRRPREWPAHPLRPPRGARRSRGSHHAVPEAADVSPADSRDRPIRLGNLGGGPPCGTKPPNR